MCKPKPGPRCSAHAGKQLHARAKTLAEAREAHIAAAQHVADNRPRKDNSNRDEVSQALLAENDALRALTAAAVAFEEARDAYETTKTGMRELNELIHDLKAENRTPENLQQIAMLEHRLSRAQASRATQDADYKMFREFNQRLDNLSAADQARVDAAATDVHDNGQAAEDAIRQFEDARAHAQAQHAVVTAAYEAEKKAEQDVNAAYDNLREARETAVGEAKRLYMEAGISERYAEYYCGDMTQNASRRKQHWGGYEPQLGGPDTDPLPLRPLAMKVKNNGPDREKMIAAKEASLTDERFIAANERINDGLTQIKAANEALWHVRDSQTNSAHDELSQRKRGQASAKYAMEDAVRQHEQAAARHSSLIAQLGSGLGSEPLTWTSTANGHRELYSNPDGSTNAYAYAAPDDAFPHGRYIPITDTYTTSRGEYSYLLKNSTSIVGATSMRGRREPGKLNEFVVVPPQQGAVMHYTTKNERPLSA